MIIDECKSTESTYLPNLETVKRLMGLEMLFTYI